MYIKQGSYLWRLVFPFQSSVCKKRKNKTQVEKTLLFHFSKKSVKEYSGQCCHANVAVAIQSFLAKLQITQYLQSVPTFGFPQPLKFVAFFF